MLDDENSPDRDHGGSRGRQVTPRRPSLGARLTIVALGVVVLAYLVTIVATVAARR